MSKKENHNAANTPATDVKQYTFGSDEDLTQVKKTRDKSQKHPTQQKKRQQKSQKQRSKQQIKQNSKKNKRKFTNKKKQTQGIDLNVAKTAEDVRKVNKAIEKEILLDIKEISRIKI